MSFALIEYTIYIFLTIAIVFSTLKVLKPSFNNQYLNDISNVVNFDFKSTFANIFNTFKIKNNKNDESLFTLIWSTTLLR